MTDLAKKKRAGVPLGLQELLRKDAASVRVVWLNRHFSYLDVFHDPIVEAKMRKGWVDTYFGGDHRLYNKVRQEHARLIQQSGSTQQGLLASETKTLSESTFGKFWNESMRLTRLVEGDSVPILILSWDEQFTRRSWKAEKLSRAYVVLQGKITRPFSDASHTIRIHLVLGPDQQNLWLTDASHPERLIHIQPVVLELKPHRQDLGWVSITYRSDSLQYLLPLAGPALELVRLDGAIRQSARDLIRLARSSLLPGSILPLSPEILHLSGFPTPLGFDVRNLV